jgi:hypothetical protein
MFDGSLIQLSVPAVLNITLEGPLHWPKDRFVRNTTLAPSFEISGDKLLAPAVLKVDGVERRVNAPVDTFAE